MYETLSVEREGHLTWLTLDRPAALNALNRRMVDELNDFFEQLPQDRETRVLVLRGAGRAFCAGLDLKEAGASADGTQPEAAERRPSSSTPVGSSIAEGMRSQRRIAEIVMRMRRAPQPILAAVHGAAAGGGFALALAADVRIGGESVRMNAAFIRLGLSACDIGVSYFLPRLVGASVASELLLTGDFIEGPRALQTGLVSRLVPDAELEKATRELAKAMLRNAPLALRLTKECLKHSIDAGSLEQVIAMEDRNQILTVQTRDFREGIRAFLEKRTPVFEDA